jgi:two-component sensor histidine kinase
MAPQTHQDAHPQAWSAVELALRCLLVEEEQHRLSNNIQLIISNFQRQAVCVSSDEARHILSYARDQIAALGRLHNMLRRPEINGEVNCRRYLADLCLAVEMLITAPRGHDLTFTATPDAESLIADAAQLHVLGLITYELLTNAAKHAFAHDAAGRIDIQLSRSGDTLVCTIADNGLGRIVPSVETQSKGMQYISHLAEEALGTCIWHFSAQGTRADIRLPLRRHAPMLSEAAGAPGEKRCTRSAFSMEAAAEGISKNLLEKLHPSRLTASFRLAVQR